MKVDFSEIEKVHGKISQNDRHTKMKEKGIFPQRPWLERPMYISCTGNTFEPYIPPEGDGKFSSISPLVSIISIFHSYDLFDYRFCYS